MFKYGNININRLYSIALLQIKETKENLQSCISEKNQDNNKKEKISPSLENSSSEVYLPDSSFFCKCLLLLFFGFVFKKFFWYLHSAKIHRMLNNLAKDLFVIRQISLRATSG